MRVFVTGATGFVGSAVVRELIDAQHHVIGLARSDAAARSLVAMGAQVHRGNLDDLTSLQSGVATADGVIHTAFNHDFAKFRENCELDRRVIEALGSVLAGTHKPLIVTSATGLLSGLSLAREEDTPPETSTNPRVASEEAAALIASRGTNVSIVRLPPSVHGDGDRGFIHLLVRFAREKGVAAYADDGANRWPAVHRLDAAGVFRLALQAGAPNARYHAVAEMGVSMRHIAEVIGRRLNLPVAALTREAAIAHFGWFAHFAMMDNPATSERTQALLGWEPMQPGLIADISRSQYFAGR